ncbi:uncharacterized protein M421DRAFT_102847 [Didymella exigua CBS 183.55]|uniref:NYN domain-containing protein n=1 Tax=Didymella exigua CBS 183.55 TaxID=1150837 RepID=A0A6A5REY0_9PLEO|nr:uncharacterized protein M421DRAFT_102847 [Didymella exigua CBS 183.55]KAF1925999.1 hypothetical protein M421DRAFT_102847 [Didymella exigua CBS 183.55]
MRDDNIAVLTDADNVSYKQIGGFMVEIANIGKASMTGWKECLLDHSFTPMQQFAYTTGKNATDGAMIVDAMYLLDSNFTRLAGRIREQGVTVYGFSKRNTVNVFVTACDKFVAHPLPLMIPTAPAAMAKHSVGGIRTRFRSGEFGKPRPLDQVALESLRKAIASSIVDDSDYAYLAEVGVRLARILPDLNARNYGYQNLRGNVRDCRLEDKIIGRQTPGGPCSSQRKS